MMDLKINDLIGAKGGKSKLTIRSFESNRQPVWR